MDEVTNNILQSIKKKLGIEPEDTNFDAEITMHINMALSICYQLGIGPQDHPFRITGEDETWDEFVSNDTIDAVKDYVFVKVKIIFDPPTSSFVLESYKELAKEFEWRGNVNAETP